jgi:hypothetical protein
MISRRPKNGLGFRVARFLADDANVREYVADSNE